MIHTDVAMSKPNKKDFRKVSIILPPDGDHGNEEEETIGAHCNILQDTSSGLFSLVSTIFTYYGVFLLVCISP
jgi:hypothetical protein